MSPALRLRGGEHPEHLVASTVCSMTESKSGADGSLRLGAAAKMSPSQRDTPRSHAEISSTVDIYRPTVNASV